MQTLVVVNGEQDWQQFLPGVEVRYRRLQTSRWLFHDGALWVFEGAESLRVDGALWRLGAVKPQPAHRAALELLRLAGVPCVNPASTLLRCYDRLAMLNELRAAGVPTLPFSVALGERVLERIAPDLPAVVKVGAFHGGWGKALARDQAQWEDIRDLTFVTDDYVTVEPFVDYARDIRCLAVADAVWAMARRAASWKVNAGVASYEVIEPPAPLREHTLRALAWLGADVLALDFLERRDGGYVCLECNDIPGFSGFPREARVALARRMREKLEQPEARA